MGRVLLGCGLVESGGKAVAQVGQHLRPRLDEIDVVAVAFLRLVALGAVVGTLGLLAVPDQAGVLALEEVELPLDRVLEGLAAKDQSSSR